MSIFNTVLQINRVKNRIQITMLHLLISEPNLHDSLVVLIFNTFFLIYIQI